MVGCARSLLRRVVLVHVASWRWCLGRAALAVRAADPAQRSQGGAHRHGAVLSAGTAPCEQGNGRRRLVGPETTKDQLVGDITSGWRLPWLQEPGGWGVEDPQKREQGTKQDRRRGFQESKPLPLQTPARKSPMGCGPREKGGPGGMGAQERTIPKSRKSRKGGRRPVWKSKELPN